MRTEPWISALKVGDVVVLSRHLDRDDIVGRVSAITPSGRVTVGSQTFNPDGSLRGGSTWSRANLREATPDRLEKIAHAERISRLRFRVKWEALEPAYIAEICAILDREPKP